jgi:ArsR family transcriptional regulator, arsenate/arsenite/antimonite-responsive transcriptional repressor
MDTEVRRKYEARAGIVKAMAHPTRLLIIEKLSQREHCVCEFQEMVGDDMSTVSKHLSILKHAGIVSVDKRGQMVFYRLNCPCVLQFLSCVESMIKDMAKAHLALVK